MKKLWRNYCYAIILLCLTMVSTAVLVLSSGNDYENTYKLITIHEGETLWDLSKQYANEHGMSELDFIAWVEKINQVDGDSIKAGESLYIPVKIDKPLATELASN